MVNRDNLKKHINSILASVLAAVMVITETPVYAAEIKEDIPGIQIVGEYAPGEAIICIQPEIADELKIAAKSAGLFSIAPEIESGFLMDVSEGAKAIAEEGAGPVKIKGSGSKKTVLKVIKSDTLSTEELIRLYSDKPGVLFAEPNYKQSITPQEEPEILNGDTSDQEMVDITKLQYAFGDDPGGMDVPGWNDPENHNADGVVVAVVDSGVDYTHPDLAPVMWDEGDKYPELTALGGGKYGINIGHDIYEIYGDPDNITEKDDPMDNNNSSHGTHCAGIIAAAWNGKGVSGAVNGARIMAVKVASNDEGSSYDETNILGFNYILTAKKAGVNVRAVNCSFGRAFNNLSYYYSIKELCENGIICCSASGNDTDDIDIAPWMACMPEVPASIIVDSSDREGKMSVFSNYGIRNTHLFAPGSYIYSTVSNKLSEIITDPDISVPAYGISGNLLYDDFDSAETIFDYSANTANGTDIEINDGVLKIKGTDINKWDEPVTKETVSENDKVVAVTVKPKERLKKLPEGKKYRLMFSRCVSDDTVWYLRVFVKTKEGKWERPGLTYPMNFENEYESYPLDKSLNGNEFDLENLEIRLVLEFAGYIDGSSGDSAEPPVLSEADIGELWITDVPEQPFLSYMGTSMATPAVTGEAAILSAAFPKDTSERIAARILAGIKPVPGLKDMCITGGIANVRNSLDEKSYTPVINSITADREGLRVKGYFFGNKENMDVKISQGNNTYSVSDRSLEIISVKNEGDDAEEILLNLPEGMTANKEVLVTVTDKMKKAGRQSFSRILHLNDPEGIVGSNGKFEMIPVPEEMMRSVSDNYTCMINALNGSMYFTFPLDKYDHTATWRYRDGEWTRIKDPIVPDGCTTVYDGKIIYFDSEDLGKLVFYDENGITEKKDIILTAGEEVTEGEEWISSPYDENDICYDLYYDGKDLLLIRFRKEYKDDSEDPYYCSAVYRLDPVGGKAAYIGKLKNSYPHGVVIVHEERAGQANLIYVIGEGTEESLLGERFTVDSFEPEVLNDLTPEKDDKKLSLFYWSCCPVKNGIYLTGANMIEKDENGKEVITADHYFLDFSDLKSGFKPCEERMCDSVIYYAQTGSGYGKVYFTGLTLYGFVIYSIDADTFPHYGDKPEEEKKPEYSDPASPLHKTDGDSITEISTKNYKYAFDPLVNTAVAAFTKADISGAFTNLPEYDQTAKHRYISSDKKTAKVNKKGILQGKKRGAVDITCQQKVKGGSWQNVGDGLHIFVQLPEMEKKVEVSLSDTGLNAYKFLSKTSYSPTKWVSTNTKVATIDDNGAITILKAGKTNIIAEYGEGKEGSKKKYKTKLVVK